MENASVFRVFGQVFFKRWLLCFRGDCFVVIDYESSTVVVFGKVFAAVARPKNVPIVAVGRMLFFRLVDGGEVADATSEVLHLCADSDVPVHVVFHDHRGFISVFDDARNC